MYQKLKPILFLLPPEPIHDLVIQLLRLAGSFAPMRVLLTSLFQPQVPGPEVKLMGIRFKNPIGLAAGFDKGGSAWRGLSTLGFGHVELGTVTPLAQPGNPKPRAYRLPEDNALINRMGFPNRGVQFLAEQIKKKRVNNVVLGVNIGKNADTLLENAWEDYYIQMPVIAEYADYVAVNVSSPNTVGLRKLQNRQYLEEILSPLVDERKFQAHRLKKPVPLVVKLSPDLNDHQLDNVLEVILRTGMDGVIVSNTVTDRVGLKSPHSVETGGLSGSPLTAHNAELIRKISTRTGGLLPIIASGGVMTAQDAQLMLDSGACLVQLYTGLVYGGPGIISAMLNSGLHVSNSCL